MRAGLTYLIYRFWTKLPENGMHQSPSDHHISILFSMLDIIYQPLLTQFCVLIAQPTFLFQTTSGRIFCSFHQLPRNRSLRNGLENRVHVIMKTKLTLNCRLMRMSLSGVAVYIFFRVFKSSQIGPSLNLLGSPGSRGGLKRGNVSLRAGPEISTSFLAIEKTIINGSTVEMGGGNVVGAIGGRGLAGERL